MKRSVLMVCVALGLFACAQARDCVLFVCAHPDDTEGFAATAFLLKEKYDLHVVDFTGGERGCGEARHLNGWTARRRKAEEEAAMSLLGAQNYWLGETDGEACATRRTVDSLRRLLLELKPKAVFTHWPVDYHPDHRQCSVAVQSAVQSLPEPWAELYFFEVMIDQTSNWNPLYSVDVTESMPKKVELLRCYGCQNENDNLVTRKVPQAELRGRERRPACRFAETFTSIDGRRIAGGVLEGLKETAVVGKAHAVSADVGERHVLFIGADGLGGRYLMDQAAVPNLRKLMARGSWTLKSRSILPSSSAANWASIFQCTGPEVNGYVDWNTEKPVFPPPVTNAWGRVPDVLSCFRAANPQAKIGLAYEWEGIAHVLTTNVCDLVLKGDCGDVRIRDYVRDERPELMAVVIDHPDCEGHKFGWGSEPYNASVARIDALVGDLLAAYEAAGILDRTVVMFTADHGGIDKSHGGMTLAETERPFVIAGPGIRRGHEIFSTTATYDAGVTLASVLGVIPPQVWTGRPIGEVFESNVK